MTAMVDIKSAADAAVSDDDDDDDVDGDCRQVVTVVYVDSSGKLHVRAEFRRDYYRHYKVVYLSFCQIS